MASNTKDMREIKFRGFYEGQMYYPDATQEYQNATFYCFSEQAKSDKERAECAIMQYTGLKDKNGKEIYEGDIVKSWYSRDTSGTDIIKTIITVEYECEPHREKAGYEIPFLRNAEVIGNIYENPELTD